MICHTEKKKIAILCCYPECEIESDGNAKNLDYGGAWLVAIRKLFDQVVDQFEFHWLVPSKSVSNEKIIERNGQFFHLYPRLKKTIGLYTGYLYEKRQVKRICTRIKPDLIHSWGTEDVNAIAGKSFKGSKLLSIQGILLECNEKGIISNFEKKQIFWEKVALRKFSNFTVESFWSKKILEKWRHNAKIHLIDYPVESFFFAQKRKLTNAPSMLYAGSIREMKGINDLITAFSNQQLQHIELRIAGEGNPEYINQLKASATGNIKFLGRISRNELIQEMASAWALVHPSYIDTGPTIVKEARVMGLPVILTENCGSKQYVVNGKSGYIIQAGNVEQLINSVLQLSSTSANCLEMGKFDKDRCTNELSGEATLNNFLKLYNQLISENTTSSKDN